MRTISGPAGLLLGPKVVALPWIPYSYAFLFAGVILLNHRNMLLLAHFHREAFRKIPNLGFSCRSSGLESFDYDSITLIFATRLENFCEIFFWFTFAHFVFYDLTWSSWLNSNKKKTDFCIDFYILHLLRYSPATNSISGVLQLTKLILFFIWFWDLPIIVSIRFPSLLYRHMKLFVCEHKNIINNSLCVCVWYIHLKTTWKLT